MSLTGKKLTVGIYGLFQAVIHLKNAISLICLYIPDQIKNSLPNVCKTDLTGHVIYFDFE